MAPNTPTRVAVITENETNVEQVVKAIGSGAQSEFDLVGIFAPSENLVTQIQNAEISLLLIDYETGEQSILDVIDDIVAEFPDVSIIALLPGNDPLIAQQVTLAGARAFLPRPFTEMNLLSTMRRVVQLHKMHTSKGGTKTARSRRERRERIGTITVFSSRGGAGCSTVATNLAIALRKKTGSNVLLMGGNLFFGHLEVMLNIKTNKSLADLIPHAGQLDETLINNVVVRHSSGIDVLVEPADIQVAQGIRPEELYKVVQELQHVYDYVVIDGGNSLTENTITLMDIADRILFLTTPELGALRNMSKFIELTRTLSYGPEKVHYILNRAGIRGGVSGGEIENILNKNLFAEIPDDHPQALMSLNRGIPMVLNHPRSPMSKAVKKIVDQMVTSG